LFESICQTPEYYPTRTEAAIMRQSVDQMAKVIGRGVRLIEYGSGSSVKSRTLLRELDPSVHYFPVDISNEFLAMTAARLREEFPDRPIEPVVADFTRPFDVPAVKNCERDVVYFPGSTIGNFDPASASALLSAIACRCGPAGGLLMGFDLQKDVAVLEDAYNDASGITAAFNRNILRHLNRKFDAKFDPEAFEHLAFYDRDAQRIEMHLKASVDQHVRIAGKEFTFPEGTNILTEYSHKYRIDQMAAIAEASGLLMQQHWIDDRQYFAVAYFTCCDEAVTS